MISEYSTVSSQDSQVDVLGLQLLEASNSAMIDECSSNISSCVSCVSYCGDS